MKYLTLKSLLILAAFMCSPAVVQAESCNPSQPSFTVDGVEQWPNKTATEIFNQAEKKELAKAKSDHRQGIPLRTLIAGLSQQGTLLFYNCEQKSLSLRVADLLSSDPEKSDYALALTRRGSFKVVTNSGSQPVLKNVNSIQLISE